MRSQELNNGVDHLKNIFLVLLGSSHFYAGLTFHSQIYNKMDYQSLKDIEMDSRLPNLDISCSDFGRFTLKVLVDCESNVE